MAAPLTGVGKKKLLEWAETVSDHACRRIEDLRDGVVLLKLYSAVWPRVVDLRRRVKWRSRPVVDWEVRQNWDSLLTAAHELRLPTKALDRAGILHSNFKACYHALVVVYFLYHLARDHNFSVDFAYPIDTDLAEFLQSPSSVDTLAMGGVVDLAQVAQEKAAALEEEIRRAADSDAVSKSASGSPSPPRSSSGEEEEEEHKTANLAGVSENSATPDARSSSRADNSVDVSREDQMAPDASARSSAGSSALVSERQTERTDDEEEEGADAEYDEETTRAAAAMALQLSTASPGAPEDEGVVGAESPSEEESQPLPTQLQAAIPGASRSVQTELTGLGLDKLLIRSWKSRREMDDLRRRLQKAGKAASISKEGAGAGGQAQPEGVTSISWNSSESQERGEVLLTQMRYEIEMLSRKSEHVESVLSFERGKHAQELEELQQSHQKELHFQKEQLERQLSLAERQHHAEEARIRQELVLQLSALKSEMAFQDDSVGQGGISAATDDAIEVELVQLRKLRIVHERQLAVLQEREKSQEALVDSLKAEVATKEKQETTVERDFSRASGKSVELVMEEASAGENSEKPLGGGDGFSAREREWSRLLRLAREESSQLKLDLDEVKLERDSLLMQHSSTAGSKAASWPDSLKEFDSLRKAERLQKEVDRLRAVNRFLRECQQKAPEEVSPSLPDDEEAAEDGRDDAVTSAEKKSNENGKAPDDDWLPSDSIGGDENELDWRLSRLVKLSEDSSENSRAELPHVVWSIVAAILVMRMRLQRSRSALLELRRQSEEARSAAESELLALKAKFGALEAAHEREVDQVRVTYEKSLNAAYVERDVLRRTLGMHAEDIQMMSATRRELLGELFTLESKRSDFLGRTVLSLRERCARLGASEEYLRQQSTILRSLVSVVQQIARADSDEKAIELNQTRLALEVECNGISEKLTVLAKTLEFVEATPKPEDLSSRDEKIELFSKQLRDTEMEFASLKAKFEEKTVQLANANVRVGTLESDAQMQSEEMKRTADERDQLERALEVLQAQFESLKVEKSGEARSLLQKVEDQQYLITEMEEERACWESFDHSIPEELLITDSAHSNVTPSAAHGVVADTSPPDSELSQSGSGVCAVAYETDAAPLSPPPPSAQPQSVGGEGPPHDENREVRTPSSAVESSDFSGVNAAPPLSDVSELSVSGGAVEDGDTRREETPPSSSAPESKDDSEAQRPPLTEAPPSGGQSEMDENRPQEMSNGTELSPSSTGSPLPPAPSSTSETNGVSSSSASAEASPAVSPDLRSPPRPDDAANDEHRVIANA